MKGPSMTALAFAGVALAGGLLIVLGSPAQRAAPVAIATPAVAPSASVANGGTTLTSVAEDLPGDAETLPEGPNVALATTACLGCHSAGMLTAQPALSRDQWAATVKKMREVYKAPVAEGDVPALLAYLESLSSPAAAATPAAAAP